MKIEPTPEQLEALREHLGPGADAEAIFQLVAGWTVAAAERQIKKEAERQLAPVVKKILELEKLYRELVPLDEA